MGAVGREVQILGEPPNNAGTGNGQPRVDSSKRRPHGFSVKGKRTFTSDYVGFESPSSHQTIAPLSNGKTPDFDSGDAGSIPAGASNF